MKDKLMALVIIALVIEVTTIVVISFLAMIGAMDLTDGCMYRYPLTNSTVPADATTAQVTVKANGNYTSATTIDQGVVVQTAGLGPQIFSDGTTGYTYGQWVKSNINVVNGQPITLGVSGAVSLCRAYLPANNLENNSANAVYSLPLNTTVLAGQPIPIPRLEESTSPIQLLFDSSASGGWRNLTNIGLHDELQVTIGANQVQMVQNGVNLNDLSSVSFQSMFSGASGAKYADCSDGYATYSPICGRYTPYNIPGQQYITACAGSVINQMRYWTCGGGGGYSLRTTCTSAHPERYCLSLNDSGCCISVAGSCRDSCPGADCTQAEPTANYWQETLSPMPMPYQSTATYTYPLPTTTGTSPTLFGYGSTTSGFLASAGTAPITRSDGVVLNSSIVCAAQNPGATLTSTPTPGTTFPGTASGSYLSRQWFWLASNAAIGLYERNNGNSAAISTDLGATNLPVQIITGLAIPNVIKNITGDGATNTDVGYLQYRFMTIGDPGTSTFQYNSGGYIIGLKQTACRALNGMPFTSTADTTIATPSNTNPLKFSGNIGDIRYLIIDSTLNPNDPRDPSYLTSASSSGNLASGTSTLTPSITSTNPQTLWFKIANDPSNYPNSFGQYTVSTYTEVAIAQFTSLLGDTLFKFKSLITNAGIKVFENMTCMNCESNDPDATCTANTDQTGCSNFFMYIRAVLTLYIIMFGMMFLLGLVKISNQDLVIRVIKIAIVAGLLSGDTLRFFNNYVFDFVVGFSDELIANISGYTSNTVSAGGNVSNPFVFLDALMSRIFFSKTFFMQVLAVLSLGLIGAFYFIIIFIAIVVLIITIFRAISIYIMAFMAVGLLLGLAPLFLTFLLFEKSFYLFENWMKFLFRYMMEPVILMAGISILTQLFTIYLDSVLGYSVCWKCCLVFKIPFSGIPGLSLVQDLPLFCINWFTPWGLDNSGGGGIMGMNIQNMVALVIISYAMYGYTELSGALVSRLTNTMSAPSMTAVGNKMASAAGQKMLKQVGMDSKSRKSREDKSEYDASTRRQSVKKLLNDQKEEGKQKPSGSKQDPKSGSDPKSGENANPANGGSLNPNATKRNQVTISDGRGKVTVINGGDNITINNGKIVPKNGGPT